MKLKTCFCIISLFFAAVIVCCLMTEAPTAYAEEAQTAEVPIEVVFCQTEARKELEMINNLRTGGNAWYWNEDDKTKTELSDLAPLQYDYALEEIVMQRALELAVSYSHQRPDGTSCFSAYNEFGYSWNAIGENIAAGYRTVESVQTAWEEEDEPYAWQGHRRNMLNANFKAFAAACVYYQGVYYWAQEFSGKCVSAAATPANDNATAGTVRVLKDNIKEWFVYPDSLTVVKGKKTDLSKKLYVCLSTVDNQIVTAIKPVWTSSDSTVAALDSSGFLTGKKLGSTSVYATINGAKLTCAVKVCGIKKQPAAKSACIGKKVTYNVTATGDGIAYLWYYRPANSSKWHVASKNPGCKTAALTVPVTSAKNGYYYKCRVSYPDGTRVFTNAAKLTVLSEITAQPATVRAALGSTVKFTVKATGAGLHYKWQYRAPGDTAWHSVKKLNGASTSALSVKITTARNGCAYRCVITDANGKKLYTDAARLYVAIKIKSQPKSVNAVSGSKAAFSVSATGYKLNYQWQIRTSGADAWKNVTALTGAKSAKLTVPAAAKYKNAYFRCVITDGNKQKKISSSAKLQIGS